MNKPDEILAVDDTPANLRLLCQMLAGHGYHVRVAPNGARALESVRNALPDLILLDIKMPHMNGYEVCENLKAAEATRDIPIIFISALDEVQDKVRGFRLGGVDYITKPFEVEEVLARVETHLKLRHLQQQLQMANGRMRRELQLAGHMQANFMPRAMPSLNGWEIAAALHPARETSGDFYDLFPLPGGRLGILLADVVDKGVAAALFMVLSWSLLRERTSLGPDQPAQVLAEVNCKILEILERLEYVTAFLGILDPASGRLIYANAGQDPPMFVSGVSGKVTRLKRTGLPLGVSEEAAWTQAELRFDPGDGLVLYTDGVTEACNPASVPFGAGCLEACIQHHRIRSAEGIQKAVLAEIEGFLNGEPPQDDVALLVIKRV